MPCHVMSFFLRVVHGATRPPAGLDVSVPGCLTFAHVPVPISISPCLGLRRGLSVSPQLSPAQSVRKLERSILSGGSGSKTICKSPGQSGSPTENDDMGEPFTSQQVFFFLSPDGLYCTMYVFSPSSSSCAESNHTSKSWRRGRATGLGTKEAGRPRKKTDTGRMAVSTRDGSTTNQGRSLPYLHHVSRDNITHTHTYIGMEPPKTTETTEGGWFGRGGRASRCALLLAVCAALHCTALQTAQMSVLKFGRRRLLSGIPSHRPSLRWEQGRWTVVSSSAGVVFRVGLATQPPVCCWGGSRARGQIANNGHHFLTLTLSHTHTRISVHQITYWAVMRCDGNCVEGGMDQRHSCPLPQTCTETLQDETGLYAAQ